MAGLLSFFNSKGIDEYVEEARAMEGALIIDVRSPVEYANGHIKGALNVPGSSISDIEKVAPDKQTPLYVHCLSGQRSMVAVRALRKMGYENTTNIGGISHYSGKLVKGA